MIKNFPFYSQLDAMDCGATCLKMIAKYYGKIISIETLRERCNTGRDGVSLLGISDAAETIGMHTLCARLSFESLNEEAPMPCIVHWRSRHFLIVYKIKNDIVYVADPAHGLAKYSKSEFMEAWIVPDNDYENPEGFALFIEPTPEFYESSNFKEEKESTSKTLLYYLKYLKPYKKYYTQLALSLAVATIIQITFPFLTQSLVDIGVTNQDLSFVYLILFAQIALFISQKAGEFLRGWLLLHITARVNLTILSDFLVKLMKLPISYFERKTPGDIMQRIDDHQRIQQFFTSSSIEFIFTLITMLSFGSILAIYNISIFLIFTAGTALYFCWIVFFMKKRRELDYKNFDQAIVNQNNTIQLITGMREIKLQNCETQKRWEWERIQAKFFKLGVKGLTLSQFENTGSAILNELKNILLTFYSAKLVIEGEMTLGMMLATQYIVGQLNWLSSTILTFLHSYQDAKLSAERLAEIHNKDSEETSTNHTQVGHDKRDINIENMTFRYGGKRSPDILSNINLKIPNGKITAIVGESGSGKSTLLKLLLKSYAPKEGVIKYGEADLHNISYRTWRDKFACVTQDSYIFSDSIVKNIAIGEEKFDLEKLKFATLTANIRGFIEQLPLGYNTIIGDDGVGLSQGQRQRILLARAIYKDSDIILLDEATNSLDANNEKEIVENLNKFFSSKTVVVVAHRLSTVKDADQIIVLDNGSIAEIGTHEELVNQKGKYYQLVKNQIDIQN